MRGSLVALGGQRPSRGRGGLKWLWRMCNSESFAMRSSKCCFRVFDAGQGMGLVRSQYIPTKNQQSTQHIDTQ